MNRPRLSCALLGVLALGLAGCASTTSPAAPTTAGDETTATPTAIETPASTEPAPSPTPTPTADASSVESRLDASGGDEGMCVALIGGERFWEPRYVLTTRSAPRHSLIFTVTGNGETDIERSIACAYGSPNSEFAAEWGYIKYSADGARSFAGWLAQQPGAVTSEDNGRTLIDVPVKDDLQGHQTRHYSFGDHDLVYASSSGMWSHIIDL